MWQKQVIGKVDGVNTLFKTFEMRRITNFISPDVGFGVYVDGVLVTVSSENLDVGSFIVAAAPDEGKTITANYNVQWFTDEELTEFLVSAAEWVSLGDEFLKIPVGLRPAAKEYAASQAYQKLVSRFSMNLAETYQLYDAPDQKRFDPISAYMNVSKKKFDMAFKLRDDFYSRQGQSLQPLTGVVRGRVRDVPPKR